MEIVLIEKNQPMIVSKMIDKEDVSTNLAKPNFEKDGMTILADPSIDRTPKMPVDEHCKTTTCLDHMGASSAASVDSTAAGKEVVHREAVAENI